MPVPSLSLSAPDARRFLLRTLALAEPHPDVATALAHHGYIQIDPINVCGRMHDLILRNRVADYTEGDLMRHLHGPAGARLPATARTAFEHHLPSTGLLVALTVDAWPHLLAEMRVRTKRAGAWSGRLTARERDLAPHIFDELRARGPLGSEAIVDDRRAHGGWGSASLAKSTMQKLFFHGRLLIADRDNGRRLYDLPERVLPAEILAQAPASPAETTRWESLLILRQRRLARLTRAQAASVADLVTAVNVPDCSPLHCLTADLPLLDAPAVEHAHARLLAPLDPLIYDRRVTEALWAFRYTWEVYTPPAKRQRGYYALPILSGDALVGHVDPKADRATGRLHIVNRQVRRGHAAAPAIKHLATFLGLRPAPAAKTPKRRQSKGLTGENVS